MAYQSEQLKEGLMADLTQAQETASQSAQSRGAPEESSFVPKTIRYKNKAIAQDELEQSKDKIEELVKKLSQEAGFVDELETSKFENDLRKRFNQFQLMAIRQAGRLQAEISKRGLDQKKKMALIGAFGNIVSGIASGAIENWPKSEGAVVDKTYDPKVKPDYTGIDVQGIEDLESRPGYSPENPDWSWMQKKF